MTLLLPRRRLLAASAAALLLTPTPLLARKPLKGGTRVTGYHAGAVRLDGATTLRTGSLSSTDNNFYGLSFWFKDPANVPTNTFLVHDPNNAYSPLFLFSDLPDYTYDAFAVCSAGGAAFRTVQDDVTPTIPGWHSCVICQNSNTGAGKIYVDRQDRTEVGPSAGSLPFTIATNGLELIIGADTVGGPGPAVDIADLRIAPGQNWLTAGNITTATLNLFTTAGNKPVDPAVATATLGTPVALFSGNATVWATQAATQGFTIAGTMTNASTSPSD